MTRAARFTDLKFETNPDRGYVAKAWWDPDDLRDAWIEIVLNGESIREFSYPAYKIYNIAAHFAEIVDGEIANSDHGYRVAAWTGLT